MPADQRSIAADWARANAGGSLRWPTGDRAETLDLPKDDWDLPVPGSALPALRAAVADGILAGDSTPEMARRIRSAILGTNLHHVLEVVACAEQQAAFAFATVQQLKSERAKAGDVDPRVFRRVAPVACVYCRRLRLLPQAVRALQRGAPLPAFRA